MTETMVGKFWFPTKQSARDRARKILRGSRNLPLYGQDLEYVQAMIAAHPDSGELSGPGISTVYVGTNTHGSPGFHIRRVDGTVTKFSHRECFGARRSHREEVLSAMRCAVNPQIRDFKESRFRPGMVCPVTGAPLVWGRELHVDHVDPLFTEIAGRYVLEYGGYGQIPVENTRGNGGYRRLAPPHLVRFARYHHELARLRLTTAAGNLKRPARKQRIAELPGPDEILTH